MKRILILWLLLFSLLYGQRPQWGSGVTQGHLNALKKDFVVDTITYNIPYYDDLRFPVTGINPPGAASDPTRETTYGTLTFSPSATNMIAIVAQLPHGYKQGTDLEAHVHWAKTTSAAGAVYWQLDYRWARIGETMDGSWTTVSSTTPSVSDDNTAEQHAITAFTTIDGSAAQISDILVMQLSRIGGNAADTYGAAARLLEIDIHYRIDRPGSTQEFIK